MIKLSVMLRKFIEIFVEMVVKSVILISFAISTLIFVYFISKIGLDFNVDYRKTDICVDLGYGGGWDYQERVCRLGLMR
jgi:hypothetical protein